MKHSSKRKGEAQKIRQQTKCPMCDKMETCDILEGPLSKFGEGDRTASLLSEEISQTMGAASSCAESFRIQTSWGFTRAKVGFLMMQLLFWIIPAPVSDPLPIVLYNINQNLLVNQTGLWCCHYFWSVMVLLFGVSGHVHVACIFLGKYSYTTGC